MSQLIEDRVQQGRDAYRRHAWHDAFDSLREADSETALSPDDLGLLAESAWFAGDPDRRSRRGKPRCISGAGRQMPRGRNGAASCCRSFRAPEDRHRERMARQGEETARANPRGMCPSWWHAASLPLFDAHDRRCGRCPPSGGAGTSDRRTTGDTGDASARPAAAGLCLGGPGSCRRGSGTDRRVHGGSSER